MKPIIIFLLALLPATLMAKNYKYNKIYIAQSGSDNLSTDKVITREANGNITINKLHLRIDGKEYKLRPWKVEDIYKAKGYLFKFVYAKGELDYVQKFRYDKVIRYCVQQPEAGAAIATN